MTIKVTAEGRVQVKCASTRKQTTLGPDSPAERVFAIEVAESTLRSIRSEDARESRPDPVNAGTEPLAPLTVRQVWLGYTQSLLGPASG